MSTEGNQLRHDKILAFVVAAVADPTLVAVYREAGSDYLRRDWGFSDEDVDYIEQEPPADAPSGGPATLAMTVWPQPPIVWPRPPTVWQ